jgi:hypothetical protein
MSSREIERLQRACAKAGLEVHECRWEEESRGSGRDPKLVFAGLNCTDPISGYPIVIYSREDLAARLLPR